MASLARGVLLLLLAMTVLFISCTEKELKDGTSNAAESQDCGGGYGLAVRGYFHSFDELISALRLLDHEDALAKRFDMDSAGPATTRFISDMREIDFVMPKNIKQMELTSGEYIFSARDAQTFLTLKYQHNDIYYQVSCRLYTGEESFEDNGMYQSHIAKEKKGIPYVTVEIDGMQCHMFWQQESTRYTGTLLQDGYVISILVFSGDQAQNTQKLSERWDMTLFEAKPLAALIE